MQEPEATYNPSNTQLDLEDFLAALAQKEVLIKELQREPGERLRRT